MQILNYSDNRCTKFARQWSKITVFYLACQVLISWLQASKREFGSVWFQTWTVGMLFSQEDHHDMAFLFPQFLKIHLNSIKLKIFNKAISPSLPPPQKNLTVLDLGFLRLVRTEWFHLKNSSCAATARDCKDVFSLFLSQRVLTGNLRFISFWRQGVGSDLPRVPTKLWLCQHSTTTETRNKSNFHSVHFVSSWIKPENCFQVLAISTWKHSFQRFVSDGKAVSGFQQAAELLLFKVYPLSANHRSAVCPTV